MKIEITFSRLQIYFTRRLGTLGRQQRFVDLPTVSAQLEAAAVDYNRELRARRRRRRIAAAGVIFAVVVVALSLGTLLGAMNDWRWFTGAAVVLIWGIWGGCYLNDHHRS